MPRRLHDRLSVDVPDEGDHRAVPQDRACRGCEFCSFRHDLQRHARHRSPVLWAVTVAFALTTVTAYVINRRWSFKLNDGKESVGETTRFVVINLFGWGATISLMWLAEAWFGPLSRIGENVALLLVAGIVFVPKFATYRDVVFKLAHDARDPAEEPLSADR